MSPNDGRWFCVQSAPREEQLACGGIQAAGLAAYLPVIPVREPHGRFAMRTAVRPVFPSYLFTRCTLSAEDWHRVASTRGVARILGTDRPVPLREEAIEAIRLFEREQHEKFARARQLAALAHKHGQSGLVWSFSAGDRVRIRSGPFSGFYAELQTAVDKWDRVRALVAMFNAQVPLTLSAHDLEHGGYPE
jgi:transcriptional antiterminator RfaH